MSAIAAMIQTFEEAAKVSLPFLKGRDPDYDAKFYDTALLTEGERKQAYESSAPEGSIVIVQPGSESAAFDVCACEDEDLGGEARAREVVALFDAYCRKHPISTIETVVIPGCGSSPVGAVALAKTAANTLGQSVAGIVSGRGQLDAMWEVASGGMVMGPIARFFSFVHPALHVLAETGKFAAWARHETRGLCSAVHEAATLLALLRARVIVKDETGITLRRADDRRLQMIVGHSKANWAVLLALLNFELDIVPRLQPSTSVDRHIDVVTFGNPVDLPDREPLMREIFHYHQFMGSRDILAELNVLPQMWMKWYWSGNCGQPTAQTCTANPHERLIPGCEHNLIANNPTHMPIERLLPLIRAN